MKTVFFLLFALFSQVHADEALVEAKLGYFFFTDSTMRSVFNEGGIDAQISTAFPVYKCLQIYGAIEYMQKWGHSIGAEQRTTLTEVPLSLGLRPVIPITNCLDYYFTVGPRYFFVNVHNCSPYVPKKMSANGCGGFVNTGILYRFDPNFTLDLFGEYSYLSLRFRSRKGGTEGLTAQVGGLTFGAGLGYSF